MSSSIELRWATTYFQRNEIGRDGMIRHKQKLRALEIFEAVSRHEAIHLAAAELGITQSAVSHQISKLTDAVGEKLLVKSGRGVTLTAAGRQLAARLQAAFNQIEQSLADVVGANRATVRIAVCSSFAPGWLIGRLGSFYEQYPQIDVQLRMYSSDPELTDSVADAFVTTRPTERGFWSLELHREELVAVAPKAAIANSNHGLPLITTTLDPGRTGDDWIAWCATSKVPLESLHTGRWLQASHYVLALEMVKNGLGMALVPDFLAEREIAGGTVAEMSPIRVATHDDYYLCIKSSRRSEPHLRALEGWFRRQVEPFIGGDG